MIPPHVLKIAAEELAAPLTEIFNHCILEKYWPDFMEEGRVDPSVQKRGPAGEE